MEKTNPIWQNLQRFANDHKVILQDRGEVGFGRPCVGFLGGHGYVDFNPYRYKQGEEGRQDFEHVPELQDDRLRPPRDTVTDAYHKHDCLAVLVHNDDYDEGLRQLNLWVEHLEAQGRVEIVEYDTGAVGLQAAMTGFIGRAVVIRDKQEAASEQG
jgi:hypothetical protein